jgi:hypothetical protein
MRSCTVFPVKILGCLCITVYFSSSIYAQLISYALGGSMQIQFRVVVLVLSCA